MSDYDEKLKEQERREQAAIAGDARLNVALPHSAESEEWLLSMLLQTLEAGLLVEKWHTFGRRFRVDLFYHTQRGIVYQLLEELAVSGQAIDCITFTGMLRTRGELDAAGGAEKIMTWFQVATVTDNLLNHHLNVLEEMRARRGMLRTAWSIAAAATDTTEPWKKAVEKAEGDLFNLHEQHSRRGTRHIREVLPEVQTEIEVAYANRGHVTGGMALGMTDLDRVTMGLKTGLFVIAARPSRGKTVLGCQLAVNVGCGQGHYTEFKQAAMPVLFVSLETTDRALTRRMLFSQWAVPISEARQGTMSRENLDRLKSASLTLKNSHIFLHEAFGMSIQELRATVRLNVARHGIKLVIVDYLQLLTSSSKAAQYSRQAMIAEVSTGLKHLAHEFDIPVIALAQLNREGDGARPSMADLRDSGQIEQDADYIAMICDAPQQGDEEDGIPTEDQFMGLDLVKNKDGPTTTDGPPIVLYFDKSIFRLRSWTDSLLSNNTAKYQAAYTKPTKASKKQQARKDARADDWSKGLADDDDELPMR